VWLGAVKAGSAWREETSLTFDRVWRDLREREAPAQAAARTAALYVFWALGRPRE